MNTENFSNSFNSYESLAEAYESFGDKKKAIENYKKSLNLYPNNQHARMKLEILKKSE